MFLKIQNGGAWDFGKDIEFHMVEIDHRGIVQRVIDVNRSGEVISKSPSFENVYGVTDHPPFDTKSDWSEVTITKGKLKRSGQKNNAQSNHRLKLSAPSRHAACKEIRRRSRAARPAA